MPALILAAAILALLAGSGFYVVHQMRASDRAEIESLTSVAQHNAEQVARERAQAARYAEVARKATDAHGERERALRAQIAALEAAQETSDEEGAEDDPAGECTAGTLVLRWPEDGGEDGDTDVSDDAAAGGLRPLRKALDH